MNNKIMVIGVTMALSTSSGIVVDKKEINDKLQIKSSIKVPDSFKKRIIVGNDFLEAAGPGKTFNISTKMKNPTERN